MRKHPLIALTAFTALTASAVAGASTGTLETNSILTGDHAVRVAELPARAAARTTAAVSLASRPARVVSGGPDLVVVHDLLHSTRLHLNDRTGLPIRRRPHRRTAVPPSTWAPPATEPAVVTTTTAAPPATPIGGVWYELRVCESGDNYGEDTGNGYYGAYQFSLATWYGLGFTGLPSEASPAVQDEAAQRLQAEAGWGQWPSCAAELGL